MKTIEKLSQLYDKHAGHCQSDIKTCTINEKAGTAELRTVQIISPSLFDHIQNPFYKGLTAMTSDRSTRLKDKDSDAILVRENGATKSLIFLELKSSLLENEIKRAIKQNLFTLLKLHMMLSLCEDYSIRDYDIQFLIACRSCDEELLSIIKDRILQHEESGDMDYTNNCIKSLLFNGNNWSCTIAELPFLNSFKHVLHQDILSSKITFKILTTVNPTDRALTYHL